jgi:hypothetical protein
MRDEADEVRGIPRVADVLQVREALAAAGQPDHHVELLRRPDPRRDGEERGDTVEGPRLQQPVRRLTTPATARARILLAAIDGSGVVPAGVNRSGIEGTVRHPGIGWPLLLEGTPGATDKEQDDQGKKRTHGRPAWADSRERSMSGPNLNLGLHRLNLTLAERSAALKAPSRASSGWHAPCSPLGTPLPGALHVRGCERATGLATRRNWFGQFTRSSPLVVESAQFIISVEELALCNLAGLRVDSSEGSPAP